MNICVAGWYFDEMFYARLFQFRRGWDVFAVKHRYGDTQNVHAEFYENHGLEFGCYQKYLENHWRGESDVLFLQDDGKVYDPKCFIGIEAFRDSPFDQSFIFNNEYEEFVNMGRHGRAFWCRGSWLKTFKEAGGFNVDWANTGDIDSPAANKGIAQFAAQLEGNPRLGWSAIVPGLQMGRRGVVSNQCYQFKRLPEHRGLMSPPV